MDQAMKNDGVAAGGILTEAANIVEGARAGTHGAKERSFAAIGMMWTAYLAQRPGLGGTIITAADVSQMMVLLKMMRASQGTPVRDHFVDQSGYSGITGEIMLHGDKDAERKMRQALQAIVDSNTDTGTGERLVAMEKEIEKLSALVIDGERRLDAAAIAFGAYAQHHHAKSPPDAIKAQRNADLAAMCNGRAAMGFADRPTRISFKDDDLPDVFRNDEFTIPPLPSKATRVVPVLTVGDTLPGSLA